MQRIMTEYTCFNPSPASSVCRICLQAGDSFRNLKIEQTRILQLLVPEMPGSVQTCNHCAHLAAKFVRFAHQCRSANKILANSNILSPQLRPFLDMTKTETVVESFGVLDENSLKTEELSDVGGDEMGLVDENDDDGDLVDDDDDVPLSLISKDIELVDPALAEAEETKPEPTEPLKLEPPADGDKLDSPPKVKKKKKRTKGGKERKNQRDKDAKISDERFSSRMVRETDRYLVVKLTKDEVRQEMAERATGEAYLRAPFKCPQCVKGFNFEDVLRNHMEKHTKNPGSLECDICFQHCAGAVSLRGHYKSHTTRYRCKVCGATRGSRQHLLEHHARAHAGDAAHYACPHCAFVTDKRTVLQRHARSHVAAKLPCERCGRVFKTVEALRVHTSRHDRASLPQCAQCGARFVHASALRRHEHAVHVRGDYYCVECDVRFKSPENMKNHFEKAKVHRQPSSFKHQCPECDAVLLTRATLSVHLCAAHGHARAHACALCPRAYGSRDALRGHARRAHAPAKPPRRHRCAVCDKSFEQKCSLARHWRVHTGERAHACPVCPQRFAQASTRDTHRALVHDKRPPRNSKRKTQTDAEYKADAL